LNPSKRSSFQQATRFESIIQLLLLIGLWCFPIRFKSVGDKPFTKFDKVPLVKWKPFQDRPPTQTERDEWRVKFPKASGGIPTGPGTGLLIIDVDTPDAIEWIELRGMPSTPLVRTRRGIQYYLRYPLNLDIHNSASAIGEGIDLRATGGMVAAVGSSYEYMESIDGVLTLRSFTYEWESGCSPADVAIADAPSWLLTWLRKDAERRAPVVSPAAPQPYRGRVRAWAKKAYDANLDLLRCAQEGTRNITAWNVARRLGQFCGGGELSAPEVLAALFAVANTWPNTAHTLDTINRAFKAGEAQPRSAPSRHSLSRRSSTDIIAFDTNEPLGSENIALYDEPLGSAD
jgi:hypothetical protein